MEVDCEAGRSGECSRPKPNTQTDTITDPNRPSRPTQPPKKNTNRSDFPNQINNVCVFPHIFRGALDCRARCINEEMKLAATHAIAAIARKPAMLRKRTPSTGDIASLVGSSNPLSGSAGGSASGDGLAAGNGSGDGSSGALKGSVVSCSSSVAAGSVNGGGPLAAALRAGSPGLRSGSPGLRRKSHTVTKSMEDLSVSGASAGDFSAHGGAAAAAPVFGRNYIIPRPFDDRLAIEVAAAVVQAAIDTGVARIVDIDMAEYKRGLTDLTLRMNL